MIRILRSVLLCSLYAPLAALCATEEPRVPDPVQIVAAFQKLPSYEMFCSDETWGGAEPIKVGALVAAYLSNEFNRLFMWSQCVEPEIPPQYVQAGLHIVLWDIRSGTRYGSSEEVQNVRVRPAKYDGSNNARVKVTYDTGWCKNLTTTYTLIREDGHWKIDDIAPKGCANEMEQLLPGSESIKTEMQKNYRAAEERYKREQAKKGAAPRP